MLEKPHIHRTMSVQAALMFILIYFMGMGIFACLYVFMSCACRSQGGQKRAPDTLELDLQMLVNCHLGVKN